MNDKQIIKKLTEELEQATKSKWISVDAFEPELTGVYLVTGHDIEIEFSHFCEDFGWQDSCEITHWMELPELPTE